MTIKLPASVVRDGVEIAQLLEDPKAAVLKRGFECFIREQIVALITDESMPVEDVQWRRAKVIGLLKVLGEAGDKVQWAHQAAEEVARQTVEETLGPRSNGRPRY